MHGCSSEFAGGRIGRNSCGDLRKPPLDLRSYRHFIGVPAFDLPEHSNRKLHTTMPICASLARATLPQSVSGGKPPLWLAVIVVVIAVRGLRPNSSIRVAESQKSESIRTPFARQLRSMGLPPSFPILAVVRGFTSMVGVERQWSPSCCFSPAAAAPFARFFRKVVPGVCPGSHLSRRPAQLVRCPWCRFANCNRDLSCGRFFPHLRRLPDLAAMSFVFCVPVPSRRFGPPFARRSGF